MRVDFDRSNKPPPTRFRGFYNFFAISLLLATIMEKAISAQTGKDGAYYPELCGPPLACGMRLSELDRAVWHVGTPGRFLCEGWYRARPDTMRAVNAVTGEVRDFEALDCVSLTDERPTRGWRFDPEFAHLARDRV